ncbi:low temperature requirement protein A [Micromonospora endolithica]|uniref:Low temperature requirement protein A n=1 Tax=Micromonospora endolithica TaxID=230091 RepID=A0A3A9YQS5_9ACTN|nr:low temperature requirement protein A [Micromonospora endolithica]RKN38249.1 low temperature requirement protein A [Micromonospora endolithica]TWJ25199.1 low temperature requirement protein LtrA [Micromonospora endolithica]
MSTRATALLRKSRQPQRASLLELFFDLVFIFALNRVSHRLFEDLSERRMVIAEAGETLLLLLAFLVLWFVTAWVTDIYDPHNPQIQFLVYVAMLGALMMAVAVPQAFGDGSLVFAGAYVAIHLVRGLVIVPALRGHEAQRRAAGVLLWFGITAVPWIAGAILPEPARGLLWTLAITIDFAGLLLFYPAPWTLPAPRQWPVVAEYMSERYRMFFIIALGELILTTGSAYSDTSFREGGAAVAFTVSFTTTVLLFRVYLFRAGELLPEAITAAPEPSRLIREAFLAHILMTTGIVVIAVGYELVIKHPSGHADPAWILVILGGPILFLAGRSLAEHSVFNRVSRSRLIGALVLAGACPVMIHAPPLATAGTAVVVLAGIATADAWRAKGRPPEQPSPPPTRYGS